MSELDERDLPTGLDEDDDAQNSVEEDTDDDEADEKAE